MTNTNLPNKSVLTLDKLAPGSHFCIQRIRAHGEVGQRLLDMGFIRNATGQVLREALLKDPIEVVLNGSRISLRRSEARLIEVTLI